MIRAALLVTAALLLSTSSCGTAPRSKRDQQIGTYMASDLVSKSRGAQDGFIVMWPRVHPAALTQKYHYVTAPLQHRLQALVRRTFPGRAIDIRPEPERVCPREGCRAISVGVTLITHGLACAAVVTLTQPGKSGSLLIPWGGDVKLRQQSTPFRAPPENAIVVQEFVPCGALNRQLTNQPAVEKAIQRLGF